MMVGATLSWVTEVSVAVMLVPLSLAVMVRVEFSREERLRPVADQLPPVTVCPLLVMLLPKASEMVRSTVKPVVAVPEMVTLSSSVWLR